MVFCVFQVKLPCSIGMYINQSLSSVPFYLALLTSEDFECTINYYTSFTIQVGSLIILERKIIKCKQQTCIPEKGSNLVPPTHTEQNDHLHDSCFRVKTTAVQVLHGNLLLLASLGRGNVYQTLTHSALADSLNFQSLPALLPHQLPLCSAPHHLRYRNWAYSALHVYWKNETTLCWGQWKVIVQSPLTAATLVCLSMSSSSCLSLCKAGHVVMSMHTDD